ncbi:MAG: flagellar biosynthesis anti-sigma factor FlgM [Peptococcaceae bacterium]|jgi:flagellar biosynthesis anti-sigma factor FlgM|nr:flagellar biosynthesis anti-sigma factor FlgM [Peptococcaceae bacterium]
MRINNSQYLQNISQLYKQQLKETDSGQRQAASGKKTDELALSRDLRDFQLANQALQTLLAQPQNQAKSKLEALKEAVQSGAYEVNAQAIAERMAVENFWSAKL